MNTITSVNKDHPWQTCGLWWQVIFVSKLKYTDNANRKCIIISEVRMSVLTEGLQCKSDLCKDPQGRCLLLQF